MMLSTEHVIFSFFRGEGQALASSFLLVFGIKFLVKENIPPWGVGENKKRNSRLFPVVKTFYFWLSKLANLDAKNDLNGNPETSEHFSEMRRAEEKISLFSGSSLSVTSSLSNEANTNLIAHNNDRLPLRTSSLNDETNTNLIAHNNSGLIFSFSCCLKGYFSDAKVYAKGKLAHFQWKLISKNFIHHTL